MCAPYLYVSSIPICMCFHSQVPYQFVSSFFSLIFFFLLRNGWRVRGAYQNSLTKVNTRRNSPGRAHVAVISTGDFSFGGAVYLRSLVCRGGGGLMSRYPMALYTHNSLLRDYIRCSRMFNWCTRADRKCSVYLKCLTN